MKKLLLFASILISFAASAQHNGEGYAPKVFSYGNWFNRARFDSALHVPNKAALVLNDLDTTPQIFVFNDTLRYYANGTFRNIGAGSGGGGTYTADEVSLHLTGTIFSIKSTWTGQNTINTVGTITNGIWNSTAISDAYIASSATWNGKLDAALLSGKLFVGNGSNIATAVTPSGDWTISNAGVATLASVVTAGSCTACNVTFDVKGRATAFSNGAAGGAPFADNVALVKNNADNTRLLIFDASLLTTATTRTWKFPNVNGTVARNDAAQTFTGVQSFLSAPNFLGSSTATYVWTATDAIGNGGWAASPAGMNQLTGDGTAGPGTGSQALTLATVNGNVGTWGDASHVGVFTVNAKGLITAASSVSVVGSDVITTITSGTSSTVPNGTNIIQFNSVTVLTYTLTLPTTWHSSNDLLIAFTSNGTILNSNAMVTLTIVAGSGQTFSYAVNPSGTTYNAGEVIRFHLIGTVDQRIN